MKNKYTVICVIGSGRSGSTILDLALGSNSQCFSVGEVATFRKEVVEDRLCTCGEKYYDCNFWKSVDKSLSLECLSLYSSKSRVDLACPRNINHNPFRKVKTFLQMIRVLGCNDTWVNHNKFFYESVFETSGKKIIIDSSKSFRRALILKNNIKNIDFKLVHLVRDLRSVCVSCRKKTYSACLPPNYERITFDSPEVREIEDTMRVWCRENFEITAIGKYLMNNSIIRVRYEDLVQKPQDTLGEVCAKLGLPYESEMKKFGSVIHHNVGGNPSRFNSKEIQSIEDKWKEKLSQREIDYLTKEAHRLLSLYGYL